MRFLCQILIIFLFIPLISGCSSLVRAGIYPVPTATQISIEEFPGSKILQHRYNQRDVSGLYFKGGDTLIVIFHAENATINDEIPNAKRFAQKGNSVLIIEYPGYGVSGQYRPDETDIYDDSEALLLQVQRSNKHFPDNTKMYGISLGAAVAVEMVRREHGTKLICVAPFTSMHEIVVKRGTPDFLEHKINNQSYNNLKKAPDIECPVLIVSGKGDKAAPHKMAVKLSEVFPNCELITLDSARHCDLYRDFDDSTWKRVLDF